jgi:hypothetical protein
MSFMITSETSKQYLLEEDAVKGFEMAVANGQSRLALTILVDVVNGIMEVFNAMMEDEQEESKESSESPKVQPVEEKVQEKKKPEPKKDQTVEKDDKKTAE